jgi:FkbM family methyltransferase
MNASSVVRRAWNKAKRIGNDRLWGRSTHFIATSFEEQIYAAAIRDGDNCIDVGANSGSVAVILSSLAGKRGTVVAFEPAWPTFCKLCSRIQSDRHTQAPIMPMPFALADRSSISTIVVPLNDFGLASLAEDSGWCEAHSCASSEKLDVTCTTLDSFLTLSRAAAPDFIKIDVEGAELLVVLGAEETLRAYQPLLFMEVFAPWEKCFGYTPSELFHVLARFNYRYLFACSGGLVEHTPTSSQPFPREYRDGYNIIAHVPGKHDIRMDSFKSLRLGHGGRILPMAPPPRPNECASTSAG